MATHPINPATGLPMTGSDYGGVDVGGNPYGASLDSRNPWLSSFWDFGGSGRILTSPHIVAGAALGNDGSEWFREEFRSETRVGSAATGAFALLPSAVAPRCGPAPLQLRQTTQT
jgi:hypothetical protein